MPGFFQFDLRISKGINLGERFRVDLIADAFNVFNHTNILAVNQLCDPFAGASHRRTTLSRLRRQADAIRSGLAGSQFAIT